MRRINNIHPDFLTDLSVPENVYFWGRFWADGSLCKTDLRLYGVKEDIDHLVPFLRSMGIHTIYDKQAKKNGVSYGRPSSIVSISSKNLVNFMAELGAKEKSYIAPTKVLSMIPSELHHYFWLGYFDGDGCLYSGARTSCAFWSSAEQDWSELASLLGSLKIDFTITKYSRKQGEHRSTTLEIRKAAGIKTFLDYLYANRPISQIGMPRKYALYLKFVEKFKTLKLKTSTAPRGVSFVKQSSKWRATIYPNKNNSLVKPKVLGLFLTQEDAMQARQQFMKEENICDVVTPTNNYYAS